MSPRVASEELKMMVAREVGIADKIRREGWQNVTTQEVGLTVRAMIRHGEQVLLKQASQTPESNANAPKR